MSWLITNSIKHLPKDATRVTPLLSSDKSALLIIDVQKFCSVPNYGCFKGKDRKSEPYFFGQVDKMKENIKRILSICRKSGKANNGESDTSIAPIERIFTYIEALTTDGRDCSLDYKLTKVSDSEKLIVPKGSEGAEILDDIKPDERTEILIPKTSCSVFTSTNIHYVLTNMGVKQLIIVGQLTNQCVESAVRDAADLGYLVTVVHDACAAKSEKEHESGLFNIKGFARIVTTDEIIQEIANLPTRNYNFETNISKSNSNHSQMQPGVVDDLIDNFSVNTLSKKFGGDLIPRLSPSEVFAKKSLHIGLLNTLKAAGVKWLRISTCDISSQIRGKSINLSNPNFNAEKLLDGVAFVECQNGLVCFGDVPAQNSKVSTAGSCFLVPDFSTLSVLPYSSTVASCIGSFFIAPGSFVGKSYENKFVKLDKASSNLINANKESMSSNIGDPSPLCPRLALQRVLCYAEDELGIKFNVGVEIEFILLHENNAVNKTNFASTRAAAESDFFMDDVIDALAKQPRCAEVDLAHAESAHGQFEIVLKYTDNAVQIADSILIIRETLHAVARKHKLTVCLLPKSDAMSAGNGMHAHFSFYDVSDKTKTNKFFDKNSSECFGISQRGQSAIAGVLVNLKNGLLAFTTPTENSFLRMAPGCWSGHQAVWDIEDKDSSIRLCMGGLCNDSLSWNHNSYLPQNFEIKAMDATANPYIALTVLLASSVYGIQNKLELPPRASLMTLEERQSFNYCSTLAETLDYLEGDAKESELSETSGRIGKFLGSAAATRELCQSALGENLYKLHVAVKRAESKMYAPMDLETEVEALRNFY